MWGRKREADAALGAPEHPLDLDEQIARLRGLVVAPGRAEVGGPLIALLTVRGTINGKLERTAEEAEDRRAAAGLLRGFDGHAAPVDRATERLVWMGLTSVEYRQERLDAALEAADRAVAASTGLGPDDTHMCGAFLIDLDRLRQALRTVGRTPDAGRVARLTSDLAARLAELDEATFGGILGASLVNEAVALATAGDLETAAAVNEEAIRLLGEHAPSSHALTTALGNRAHAERRTGRWDEALATEQQALSSVRSHRPATREEVERLNSLFLTYVRAGQPDDAERAISEAIVLARRLAEADTGQLSMLATLLGNQANIRGELHRYDDALVSSVEALALREQLAATHPSVESDKGLAMILNNHSAVLRRLDRVAEAAESAGRSVDVRRRLAQDGIPNSVALLANSLNTHAEQLGHLGEAERAVRLAEEARDLYLALPPPGADSKFLRANQETLGRVLAQAGRPDEALDAATQAVAIGRRAAAEAPGELPELARCLGSLADRLAELGRTDEAEAARTEAAQVAAAPAS